MTPLPQPTRPSWAASPPCEACAGLGYHLKLKDAEGLHPSCRPCRGTGITGGVRL